MLKRRIAIIASFVIMACSATALAADWRCAVDLNGDGCACDSNESMQCSASEDGSQVCPVGVQNCLPKYEPPVITSVPATYVWRSWFQYTTDCTARSGFGQNVSCSESFGLDTNGDGTYDSTWSGSNYPPVPRIWMGGPWNQTDFRSLADGYMAVQQAAAGITSTSVRVLSGSEYYSEVNYAFSTRYGYRYTIVYERIYGPSCPGGGNYNSSTDKCDSEPVCSAGSLTTDKKQCFLGNTICPAGNYTCHPVGGVNKCSPNACADLSTIPPDTTVSSYPSYTNNGTVTSDGSCAGIILLFNGKAGECRPSGADTAYRDCCNYGGGDPGYFNFCKTDEAPVVQGRDAGRNHFIEEYCKTRWNLAVGSVCVQRARTYCVFNSKLGRIIQEQGRLQLKSFQPNGNWGSHVSANCKGLSPEEFQMIDFSKIDMTEFTQSISETVSTQIQQKMQDSVNQYNNNLQ